MKLRLSSLVLLLIFSLQACAKEPAPSADSAISPPANPAEEPAAETGSGQLTSADIVATQRANMAPTAFPLTLVDIADGAILTASIDPGGAMPVVSFQVMTGADQFTKLALEADGQEVYSWQIPGNEGHGTRDVSWIPWHGNGDYQMVLRLLTNAGEILAEQPLSISVTGIPPEVPTVADRFTQEYRNTFGLDVKTPVFSHVHTEFAGYEEENSWVSTVYTTDTYYAVRLYDDGRVDRFYNALADGPGAGSGACPPSGTYRVLVVVVDYQNTGYSSERVLQNLRARTLEANQHWAQISGEMGLATPILQVEPTFVYLDSPPSPGSFLTAEQVSARTGLSLADFDLIAEVDVDAEKSSSPDPGAGGMAFPGFCTAEPPGGINMIVWIREDTSLEWGGGSLFEHEFMHVLGWQHEWVSGDGGTMDRFNNGIQLPYRFFGWVDADGDGTIEIYDPTPYGIGAS